MLIRFNQLFNLSVYWVPSFLALRCRAGQRVFPAFLRSTNVSRRAGQVIPLPLTLVFPHCSPRGIADRITLP